MSFLSFSSLSELYVYVTCIMLGISLLMPLNALTSAPRYMVDYYKYVTGNPDAVPSNNTFWANILTFYNVASVVTQILCGPTVLMPVMRKLSLRVRYIWALTLMMLEVFVVMVMPAGNGVSQQVAIALFFLFTITAGAGKSYLEATCYATVGTMPAKFMSALMFGCGFSGVIASILQCIIKASLPDTYGAIRMQAYIYFSLALAFMLLALIMALSLRWNKYAQEHVGEFRVAAMKSRQKDLNQLDSSEGYDVASGERMYEQECIANTSSSSSSSKNGKAAETHQHSQNMSSDEMRNTDIGNANSERKNYGVAEAVVASPILNENETNAPFPSSSSSSAEYNNKGGNKYYTSRGVLEISQTEQAKRKEQELIVMEKERALSGGAGGEEEEEEDVVRAVNEQGEPCSIDNNMTTSQQMQQTRAWPIVKLIYPIQIACFNIFFLSMFVFPSLVIPIDRVDNWFATIAILLYNCGDASGRMLSSLKVIWPSRRILIIVSFVRFVFMVLIFMYIYKYIPGHVAPYITMALIGLTNGFFGSTAMVFGTSDPRLKTDGEFVMAGQLMGISLLGGCSVASLLALLVVLYLP